MFEDTSATTTTSSSSSEKKITDYNMKFSDPPINKYHFINNKLCFPIQQHHNASCWYHRPVIASRFHAKQTISK
jgi:hypothetical protein